MNKTTITVVAPGRTLLAVSMVLASLVASAHAQWTPAIRLGVTHTDNVNLSNVNSIDQTVWRVEPSIGYERLDKNVDINLNYNLQVLRFDELSRTETFDQYSGLLRLKGWDQQVYLNIGADKQQVLATQNANLPTGNLPLNENRQDRLQYFIEPGLQLNFGGDVVLRASARQGWVDFNDAGDNALDDDAAGPGPAPIGIGNGVGTEQRSGNFELDNLSAGRGLAWAFRYNWQRADFDERGLFENQTATLELGYWFSSKLRGFGSVGRESPWDDPFTPSLEDTRWEAGFEYGAGDEFRVLMAAGDRSFGNSGRMELQRTFRRGSISLNYRETPVSENQEVFQNAAFAGPLVAENLLARPDQPERFVAKRLELLTNVTTPKTTLGFSVFRGERSDRTTLLGVPLSDDSQLGIRLNADRNFGARSTLSLFASTADRELLEGGSSDIVNARLRYGYRLGPRTTLSVEYEYANEDVSGDAGNLAIQDYTSNSISIFVQRNFFKGRR